MKIIILILIFSFLTIAVACFTRRLLKQKDVQIDRLQRLLIAAHADRLLNPYVNNKVLEVNNHANFKG